MLNLHVQMKTGEKQTHNRQCDKKYNNKKHNSILNTKTQKANHFAVKN